MLKQTSRTHKFSVCTLAFAIMQSYQVQAESDPCAFTFDNITASYIINCTGNQQNGFTLLNEPEGIRQFNAVLNISNLSANVVQTQSIGGIQLPAFSLSRQGADGDNGFAVTPIDGDDGDNGFDGQNVTINFTDTNGVISNSGTVGHGIFANTVGGAGGNGGGGAVFTPIFPPVPIPGFGGDGGLGGDGGDAVITNEGSISTDGLSAFAIAAISKGGDGGNGGVGIGFPSFSGDGGVGGSGGDITIINAGQLNTLGQNSHAVVAQSSGGLGGDGGTAVGIINIGGDGESSGSGGAINISNSGEINTVSQYSSAIFASSIGGGTFEAGQGGGDGGDGIGVISIGGGGGSAGNGGLVNVSNSSHVATAGSDSSAVVAQSIGGGGGNGGDAISSLQAVTFSFGGSGGAGGDGANVTLTHENVNATTGSVLTTGDRSNGLQAQSIGGGGGNGGYAISATASPIGSAAISLGGSGGDGGNGGNVAVGALNDDSGLATSSITTEGEFSNAISAQSIGGGGGNGGFSVAASASNGYSASFSMGGSGGGGGDAGIVSVVSTNRLVTSGDFSAGVLAQSTGGGGGNGGFSVAGGISKSGSVAASIGGSGGDGGNGNTVGVYLADEGIATTGDYSSGVLAQSIGGGGGNGGFSVAGVLGGTDSKNAAVSVGGQGGAGGLGGEVEVINEALIITTGESSHGILAQSLGGGGGNGGASVSGVAGLTSASSGSSGFNLNIGVSVGGGGGIGNTSGQVNVTNEQQIITTGLNSHGIYAQSIGGGGGTGGTSFTGLVSAGNSATNGPSSNSAFNVAIGVGGNGGVANSGGVVNITNNDTITTGGDGSSGIVAQSIGGGGGQGGRANALSMTVVTQCRLPGACPAGSAANVNANVAVGGSGGSSGNGDIVGASNTGSITTNGMGSHGIIAQSIGGGGGLGGNGVLGSGEVSPIPVELAGSAFSNTAFYQNVSVIVGGSSGANGNGGLVIVNNTGSIVTQRKASSFEQDNGLYESSYGIFAQSVGGGGGMGGNATIGLSPGVALGGGAGASGNGGGVAVVNSGSVETHGLGSHGIVAQSVGGGGGIAGNVARMDIIDTGLNVAIAQDGGSAGDGGRVYVESTGDVETFGDNAMGIFAQSVGGGGGLGGDAGFAGFAGSVGNDGNGASVEVIANNVTTHGEQSHAIFAQSAGGGVTEAQDAAIVGGIINIPVAGNEGGNVDVIVTGSVEATGSNANGIFAQSRGATGIGYTTDGVTALIDFLPSNGDISISVNEGASVVGGGNAAAIAIHDGYINSVTNHGVIASSQGASGTAISGTVGEESIENFGVIKGSVVLAEASQDGLYADLNSESTFGRDNSNSIVNQHSGIIYMGSDVDLGGGRLLNHGIISVGDQDTYMHTTLNGELTFESSNFSPLVDEDMLNPTLAFDFGGYGAGEYDSLEITGNLKFGDLKDDANANIFDSILSLSFADSFSFVEDLDLMFMEIGGSEVLAPTSDAFDDFFDIVSVSWQDVDWFFNDFSWSEQLADIGVFAGYQLSLLFNAGDGNDIAMRFTQQDTRPVSAPATASAFMTIVAWLLWTKSRYARTNRRTNTARTHQEMLPETL